MGLTNRSTGAHAADGMLAVVKRRETDSVVALAGNPNVGKSTVFNELTGMNQHTGNWPGKTVASAQGYCERGGLLFSDGAFRGGSGGAGFHLLWRCKRRCGGVRRLLLGTQFEFGVAGNGNYG